MTSNEGLVDLGKQGIKLREVTESDLPIFYEQQLDPAANYMAAFTRKDPADRDSFDAHWSKILADEAIPVMTILYNDRVVGSVLSYEQFGDREVSYWLGSEFWGKGIATRALSLYLNETEQCPIYAWAAKDNLASIRVLEKCGFIHSGEEKGFANARGAEIEEVVLVLN